MKYHATPSKSAHSILLAPYKARSNLTQRLFGVSRHSPLIRTNRLRRDILGRVIESFILSPGAKVRDACLLPVLPLIHTAKLFNSIRWDGELLLRTRSRRSPAA